MKEIPRFAIMFFFGYITVSELNLLYSYLEQMYSQALAF